MAPACETLTFGKSFSLKKKTSNLAASRARSIKFGRAFFYAQIRSADKLGRGKSPSEGTAGTVDAVDAPCL